MSMPCVSMQAPPEHFPDYPCVDRPNRLCAPHPAAAGRVHLQRLQDPRGRAERALRRLRALRMRSVRRPRRLLVLRPNLLSRVQGAGAVRGVRRRRVPGLLGRRRGAAAVRAVPGLCKDLRTMPAGGALPGLRRARGQGEPRVRLVRRRELRGVRGGVALLPALRRVPPPPRPPTVAPTRRPTVLTRPAAPPDTRRVLHVVTVCWARPRRKVTRAKWAACPISTG